MTNTVRNEYALIEAANDEGGVFRSDDGGTAWTREAIQAALKATLSAHALKMPQLAIPVRLLVFGLAQTPSVDACLALMPREQVVARLIAARPH